MTYRHTEKTDTSVQKQGRQVWWRYVSAITTGVHNSTARSSRVPKEEEGGGEAQERTLCKKLTD